MGDEYRENNHSIKEIFPCPGMGSICSGDSGFFTVLAEKGLSVIIFTYVRIICHFRLMFMMAISSACSAPEENWRNTLYTVRSSTGC